MHRMILFLIVAAGLIVFYIWQHKKWSFWMAQWHASRAAKFGQNWKEKEAIEEFQKALEYDPHCAAAYCGLGWWCNHRNEIDRAIDYLLKAIRYNPKNPMAYVYLGDSYLEKDELEKAVTEYKRAIELDPQRAVAYFDLAIAYARTGNTNFAKKYLEKALKLRPEYRSKMGTYEELRRLI